MLIHNYVLRGPVPYIVLEAQSNEDPEADIDVEWRIYQSLERLGSPSVVMPSDIGEKLTLEKVSSQAAYNLSAGNVISLYMETRDASDELSEPYDSEGELRENDPPDSTSFHMFLMDMESLSLVVDVSTGGTLLPSLMLAHEEDVMGHLEITPDSNLQGDSYE